MASTPTTRNRLNKQGTGDNAGTWGTVLNEQDFDLIDEALDGFESIAVTADVTLTSTNYVSDQARNRVLKFTGAGGFNVTIPGVEKWYVIHNACTAAVTVKTAGGVGASVPASAVTFVYCDGTDCTAATNTGSSTFTQAVTVPAGTAAGPSLTFSGDTNTGVYSPGADQIGLTTAGVAALTFNSAGAATFRAGATFAGGLSGITTLAMSGALSGVTTGAFSGLVTLAASTTSAASLRAPHGTAPTSPTNGDMWTTTTGVFARVNGVTLPLDTVSLIATNTVSAAATADITGMTGFTHYLVEVWGLYPATAATNIYIQTSADGGSTFSGASGDYKRMATRWAAGATALTFDSNDSTASSGLIGYSLNNNSAQRGRFLLWVTNPSDGFEPQITGEGSYQNSGGASEVASFYVKRTSTATINALRLGASSGNITLKYALYGIRG